MGMIVEKNMNLSEDEKEKFCKEWTETCKSLKKFFGNVESKNDEEEKKKENK